jgi:cation/acetate symporter
MVATFLGTMGLPHVVVRYYTNPDGRAARQTTLVVLVLLGLFYVLPPVYGALGRLYAPDLVTHGTTDSVVLELPQRMIGGVGGDLLTALLTGGAFAAFLATSSGLTVAVAGVISQDVISRRLEGVTAFRVSAAIGVAVPLAMALVANDVSVATVVGLAFAMAAATFCPLLVLGIWWRGLTPAGAVAGLLAGGLGASAGVAWTLYDGAPHGWRDVLLGQPAAWSVPLAFVSMVGVSLLTRDTAPGHAARFMVRLHTPEVVPLDRG